MEKDVINRKVQMTSTHVALTKEPELPPSKSEAIYVPLSWTCHED
jgi:hypothetical protein